MSGPTSPRRGSGPAPRRGFSLIELAMVMALVGILAAVAVPRLYSRASFADRAFADEAVAAVRYAQKLAIASGCDVAVDFAGGYALTTRSACDTGPFDVAVAHPARAGGFAAPAPAGVAVGSASWYFDRIGRPRSPGGALLGTLTTVTVGTRAVEVEPETGYARLA